MATQPPANCLNVLKPRTLSCPDQHSDPVHVRRHYRACYHLCEVLLTLLPRPIRPVLLQIVHRRFHPCVRCGPASGTLGPSAPRIGPIAQADWRTHREPSARHHPPIAKESLVASTEESVDLTSGAASSLVSTLGVPGPDA